ncbi:hypothetical protein AB7849_09340 [Rhodanobacter sp. 115]|uniref:hypothetical protein n=1 Tax=Rhodanobacter sp. FW021-MT20 TaxID=1162282 RepID=UPI0034E3F9F4
MLDTPLRNIAMLTGFAWKQDGQWVLQQRAPLPMALPLRLSEGVREPEMGEPIDVIGRVDAHDGLHIAVTHLSRAAKSSFPQKLKWAVRGIPTRDKDGVKNVTDRHVEGLIAPAIADMLLPQRTIPDAVRRQCDADMDLAAWVDEGLREPIHLPNRIMLTGMVENVITCDNLYATRPERARYFDVLIRTEPAPAPPVVCRLTADVHRFVYMAKLLQQTRKTGNPITLCGEFRAKVIPVDEGDGILRIDYHVRLLDALSATQEDMPNGVPDWAHKIA